MNSLANIKISLLFFYCLVTVTVFGQNSKYAPNEFLVKWKERTTKSKSIESRTPLKTQKLQKITTVSSSGLELWKVEGKKNVDIEALIKKYATHPDIEDIEPNYIYSIVQNPLYTECTHDDLELKNGADDYVANEQITYKAASTITATNVIGVGSQIKYLAEDRIFLKPGFKSPAGTSFRASIEDCDGRDDVNDTRYGEQWALHNTGQSGGTFNADINAPEGWLIKNESTSIKIAIIDTGIDWRHPDLKENIWQNLEEDFDGDGHVIEWSDSLSQWIFDPGDENGIDDDGNGYIDDFIGWDFVNNDNNPLDDHGHGTYVAGVIGAKGDNGIGVTGVTRKVQMAALKYLDSDGYGAVCGAILALEYAVQMDMPISNNSWGGAACVALRNEIAVAATSGHLFITAAGNDGEDFAQQPIYPAAYDLPNIIAVAATDNNDQLSDFSNYGATAIDIAAPGSNILTCALNGSYTQISGTSLATPYVAGASALLWDLFPDKNYLEIKQRILNGVDPISALDGKVQTGGRLNLCKVLGGCNGLTSCAFTDSLALAALHTATNGGNWTNIWDLTQPYSTWYGVSTNMNGCLTALQLADNNLTGNLPPAIGNLSYLKTLNLSDNEIGGGIPSPLGYLKDNLEFLDLSANQLTGRIPISIGELDTLKVLALNDNQLNSNIPEAIGSLTNLNSLKLHNNRLEDQIPTTLIQLVNLDTLYLNNNQLSGCLPSNFNTFCAIDSINFKENSAILGGGNFAAFCTNGTGDCDDCRSLDSLVLIDFFIAANGSSWHINWDTTQSVDTWQGVDLNENGCVIAIQLPNNGLTGRLTSRIGELSKLRYLHLENNQLTGTIPPSIGGLPILKELDLSNNLLAGTIPPTIGNLDSLQDLFLNYNQLAGVLPPALVNLASLENLYLSDNQLEGCFPQNFSRFCSINYDFENNLQLPSAGDFTSFCTSNTNVGGCTEPVWPGDFNNDGKVDKSDVLFWGLACGNEGSIRPNASEEWEAQESPDWNDVTENVNGKHQDGNGDGKIDEADYSVLLNNYGKTHPRTTVANHVTNGISYEIKRKGPHNDTGIKYELSVKNQDNTAINIHGLACSVNFGNIPVKEVMLDTTGSILQPEKFISLYNKETNTLDLALTRQCKTENLVQGRVGILIVIVDNLAFEDPRKIKIRKGKRITSNDLFHAIGSTTFYDKNDTRVAASSTNLQVTVSVTPEQCDQLGSAKVDIEGGKEPYTINWSNGATTDEISNLLAGEYTVTVTDDDSRTKTYNIEVEGLFVPIYGKNGQLIQCDPTDCPTTLVLSDPIPEDIHKAASTITATGNIPAGNMRFKAGESITLLPGFTVAAQALFSASIEACSDNNLTGTYTIVPLSKLNASPTKTSITSNQIDLQIIPNPVTYQATIEYNLPNSSKVVLSISNIQGRPIKQLFKDHYQDAGRHDFMFSAKDFAKGVYLISLQSEVGIETQKLIVLK